MSDDRQTDHTPAKTEGYAFSFSPVKWKPYKPNSEQFRKGRKGRWQEMNEYGGWHNCDAPSVILDEPLELADALRKIADLEAQIAELRTQKGEQALELLQAHGQAILRALEAQEGGE